MGSAEATGEEEREGESNGDEGVGEMSFQAAATPSARLARDLAAEGEKRGLGPRRRRRSNMPSRFQSCFGPYKPLP